MFRAIALHNWLLSLCNSVAESSFNHKFAESRKVSSLIKDVTPFNETDWADFLDISTKSLQRYKQRSKQFKPIQSEKIIELAEVTNVGKNVFGSIEKFKLWLETPNFALGNMKPKELLKDSYGKEMVIGELTRIEHGIFV
jgi:putative toxin-antitoxin system antitoxin component (TIGR02293 family)